MRGAERAACNFLTGHCCQNPPVSKGDFHWNFAPSPPFGKGGLGGIWVLGAWSPTENTYDIPDNLPLFLVSGLRRRQFFLEIRHQSRCPAAGPAACASRLRLPWVPWPVHRAGPTGAFPPSAGFGDLLRHGFKHRGRLFEVAHTFVTITETFVHQGVPTRVAAVQEGGVSLGGRVILLQPVEQVGPRQTGLPGPPGSRYIPG